MKGFVDIHCHLLPEIDDGAQTMEETVKMVSIAYKNGIRKIIATPHYHAGRYKPEKENIEAQFQRVKRIVAQASDEIELYLGHEIYYQDGIVSLLDEERLFTLADSGYVLVEFSTSVSYVDLKRALQNIVMGGYVPILAHAERYSCLVKEAALVSELVELGVYIQANADSFLNGNGHMKKFLKTLIKRQLLHVVATDAHGFEHRAPELEKAYHYIEKKYGETLAQELMLENPERIIKNEYI